MTPNAVHFSILHLKGFSVLVTSCAALLHASSQVQ